MLFEDLTTTLLMDDSSRLPMSLGLGSPDSTKSVMLCWWSIAGK